MDVMLMISRLLGQNLMLGRVETHQNQQSRVEKRS